MALTSPDSINDSGLDAMEKLQIGFVATVPKCHRLNWPKYRPSASDDTYALKLLPEPLKHTLSNAFKTGRFPQEHDLADLRKHLTTKDWICYACCDGLVAANALTMRVAEYRQIKGQALVEAGPFGSGDQTELRLRRHIKHKHGVLNDVGAIEWRQGPAPHTKGCPEVEGKNLVLIRAMQIRSAPEVRQGNPVDWTYTYHAKAEASDISAGRRDYNRPAADPAANPFLLHPARIQLMTLLFRAGLLSNLPRQSSMAVEWASLLAAIADLDGGQALPLNARASRNYLAGSSEPIIDGMERCQALGVDWAPGGVPIVTALVLLIHVRKLANGHHLATTLGLDGRRGEIELPPSVKFWAGNVAPARAPFLCLFRMITDKSGEPIVLFGYAHPVLNVDSFCTVESDIERNTAAHRLTRWFFGLPETQRQLVTIEKVEFSEAFGARNIMFDFVIRLSLSRSRQTVRFHVEQLGSIDPDYIASKIEAKLQVEATTKEGIIYVGNSSEREAIDPGLGGLEEQLEPLEQMLRLEVAERA